MHKVFISYHHDNDQQYKDGLVQFAREHSIFEDASVDTGDISDELSDEQIRQIIRDDYLRDSTVTIVLVGQETRRRKYVDWEIYSSMYDGKVNKKSGVLVVNLPGESEFFTAPHEGEEGAVYPDFTLRFSVDTWEQYERMYPTMPARIIDNLVAPKARISVMPWSRIAPGNSASVAALRFLVDATFNDRQSCEYDLSRPMRRANS